MPSSSPSMKGNNYSTFQPHNLIVIAFVLYKKGIIHVHISQNLPIILLKPGIIVKIRY